MSSRSGEACCELLYSVYFTLLYFYSRHTSVGAERLGSELARRSDHFSVTGRDLFVLAASTDGPRQSHSAVTIRGALTMVSSIRTSSGQRHEDNDNDDEREFIQRVVINKSRTR